MKNNIYTAVLLAFAVLFVGCTDDDLDGMAVNEKSTATTSVSSLTILEGRSDVIPFTISQAINVPSQFKILVTGDAINDDLPFSAGNGMDADTGIPGQGFEVTVPAYASSFEIPVETFRDLDQTQGSRTYELQISAAGVRTIVTPVTYIVNLTVEDYEFCEWTFELNDAYGDGWQGAHITVESDGDIVEYGPEGFGSTLAVPVRKGFSYAMSYFSGTTGDTGPNVGGAPGYEEENSYILTAPDGTTFADGPIPTVGPITSGTSECL